MKFLQNIKANVYMTNEKKISFLLPGLFLIRLTINIGETNFFLNIHKLHVKVDINVLHNKKTVCILISN